MLIIVIVSTGNALIRVTIKTKIIHDIKNKILQYIWTDYNTLKFTNRKTLSLW